MKIEQARLLDMLERQELNLSRSAAALGLSQPAASRLLGLLEDEMGGPLFLRRGKRLQELTSLGRTVLAEAGRIVEADQNLRAIAAERRDSQAGHLRIATTHAQARYFLPSVLQRFRTRWPNVRASLVQGLPFSLVEHLSRGAADIVICTEEMTRDSLESLDCYRWRHMFCAPRGHPLLDQPVTPERLAGQPVMTYVRGITMRDSLDRAFARHGVTLDVRLEAADTDVLKTFIRNGFGTAIIASMTYHPVEDVDLGLKSLGEVTPEYRTRAAWLKGRWLRQFERSFLEMVRTEGARFQQVISAYGA